MFILDWIYVLDLSQAVFLLWLIVIYKQPRYKPRERSIVH